MVTKLYRQLASLVQARKNCADGTNPEWFERHGENATKLTDDHMPHGSGFDSGTKLDLDASSGERLVFHTEYHHMNEVGFYDGWTEHSVIVTPSLQFGFTMRITGRNRNDIKEYMYDVFWECLNTDIELDYGGKNAKD